MHYTSFKATVPFDSQLAAFRQREILAWVLDGTMIHTGPDGTETPVPAGTLQHLVAGTGWHHDERASPDGTAHLLQFWVTPGMDDPPPGEPSLTHHRVDGDLTLALRRPGVTVTIAHVAPGEWTPADGAFRHVHVARGSLGDAVAGDSLEITGAGPINFDAGPDGAELVVVTTA